MPGFFQLWEGSRAAWVPHAACLLSSLSPRTDLRLINTQAMFAKKTGMIILGGGLVKHHIANANLMVRRSGGEKVLLPMVMGRSRGLLGLG